MHVIQVSTPTPVNSRNDEPRELLQFEDYIDLCSPFVVQPHFTLPTCTVTFQTSSHPSAVYIN